MKQVARAARAENRIVGLVPTMGALHAGHLSLVERARRECAPVYASVFVNPKQFGPAEDFSGYPRSLEADTLKLAAAGVEAVFVPEPGEVFPAGFQTYVTVEGLGDRLEGRSRPGHFRGVATVVLKLLEIMQPHFAYFGRKDAQQVRVLEQMARDLDLDTQIVVCPIVREPDGLAMSSRNAYLDPPERSAATVLFRALQRAADEIGRGLCDAMELRSIMSQVLLSERLAKLDYLEIVDRDSFEPVTRISRPSYILVAARVGRARLIDNLLIEPARPGSDELVFSL